MDKILLPNKFTVIKDTREKLGWDFEPDNLCETTLSGKLDTGDYSIAGLEKIFCIERKQTVSELAHNFIEDRFTRELERMADMRFKFLVCEFRLQDLISYPVGSEIPRARHHMVRIKYPYMLSRINSMQVKYGISVIFADNPQSAQVYAYNLFKYVDKIIKDEY